MNDQTRCGAKAVITGCIFAVMFLILCSGCQTTDNRQVYVADEQLPVSPSPALQTVTQQLIPTVVTTAVPETIPTSEEVTPIPSIVPALPSPTKMATPSPAYPPLTGLIYQLDGLSYRIDENGEAQPWTINLSADGHYYLGVIADLDISDPNPGGQIYLIDQLSGEETQLPIEMIQSAVVGDWWDAESDWVLLQVAFAGSSYESTLPHSVLVNLKEGMVEMLGGAAAANPAGTWIVYVGTAAPAPQLTTSGLWLFDASHRDHLRIEWSAFGLDLDEPPLAIPSWSANGRYLSINCFWWGECEPDGALIILDMELEIGYFLDYHYAGPEGSLYPPQWAPHTAEFLFQGRIGSQFGSWLLTPSGEVLDFWENAIFPRWISATQIAFLDESEGKGWHFWDIRSEQKTLLPSAPFVSPDGRFLAGTQVDPALHLPLSWLLDLESATLLTIPLPEHATIVDWE